MGTVIPFRRHSVVHLVSHPAVGVFCRADVNGTNLQATEHVCEATCMKCLDEAHDFALAVNEPLDNKTKLEVGILGAALIGIVMFCFFYRS